MAELGSTQSIPSNTTASQALCTVLVFFQLSTQTAVSFRAVYVFDQVDTDGKPLAELSSAEGDPSGYTEKLKQFIAQRGIALQYSDASRSAASDTR
jgi:hypothetical protein